jgi:hypothetical protein
MELHSRQQFDFFFSASIERFIERIEQRCGGPVPALARLRDDPNSDGIWIDDFVAALFADFLLDNPAGSAFVIEALGRRPVPVVTGNAATLGDWMQLIARQAFASLLAAKADEALEQRLAFQVAD